MFGINRRSLGWRYTDFQAEAGCRRDLCLRAGTRCELKNNDGESKQDKKRAETSTVLAGDLEAYRF